VTTRAPEWAHALLIEVSAPRDLWHRLTDLGMTVFDSAGNKISDSPLNYAVGRHAVSIDSTRRGGRLDIEVFPAFARSAPESRWTVDVELSFLTEFPIPIAAQDSSESVAISLIPSANGLVSFGQPTSWLALPDRFEPLLEITATPENGPAAVRRGPARFGSVPETP